MKTLSVRVTWTEETTYTSTFELEVEDAVELSHMSAVHELMDQQGAWDQVSKEGWLAPDGVNDRRVDEAEVLS